MTERRAHECILAVVGSVYDGASDDTVAHVKNAIKDAFDRHDPRWFVSGGARGVDSWAEEEADRRLCAKTINRPAFQRWGGHGGFKWRNAVIVRDCEHLVRIYDPESQTYGSGWTADYAEKMGHEVERIAVAQLRTEEEKSHD